MKINLSKEAKVGLLALVAGIMLYVGFNFLKGVEFFSPTKKYYVIYDNVNGLSPSNPVTLNGMPVGKVNAIKMLTNKGNKVLVAMDVHENIKIGDSTLATLTSTDLLGGKAIELNIGNNSVIYDGGDTLKGFKDQPMSELISQRALPIMANLDSTVVKLNALFGDELGVSIKNTLQNLEAASHDLKIVMNASKGNLVDITQNINSLTASLNETERSLKPILAKMNTFADTLNDLKLKQTVQNANAAMCNVQQITNKIEQGKGSLGLLINDKSLYENLNKSAKDLDMLFLDIQQNPKRYVHFSVFGKKDKKSKKSKQPSPPQQQEQQPQPQPQQQQK